ncbi:co-chaperone GroES [Candidatus Dojkabacteria bacterium]|nr:co-chaperone GroES [Candidatus Dojkabacteria bacterium]
MASSKVNVKPLGGKVLVKPLEAEEVTESGLIIPDTADKEKPQQGKVVALGTGRITEDGKKIPFNVKIGDTVVFKKYSPDEIEVDGEDYLIMDEADILAVM